MCGILGIIKSENKTVSIDELNVKLSITNHRGPDSTGTFIHENIGFGHNRLSLLDLTENSNQPFYDDRFVLVFNGEIYNWKNLKEELINEGVNFKTSSDTEVLFFGLKKWGVEKTLTNLKGMFAFSWFDKSEHTLILVRDRIGIKPLFYGMIHGDFYFSSEIKSLCQDLNLDDVNMHYLAQAYYGVYETQRHISPFKQIHQLEPGYLLKLNTQNLDYNIVKWFGLEDWVVEKDFNHRNNKTSQEITEEFGTLFNNSVSSMSVSDAPMGTFVSGGIDSSVVAATSKNYADLQLFTANVEGKFSEIKDARYLSKSLKTDLNEYKYLPDYFIRDIVDCTWHYEAPIVLFTNSVAFSGVAELARQKNVKAVLTGEGADELFLGYPKLLTQRWDNLIQLPYDIINAVYQKVPGLKSYLKINSVDMQKEILQSHLNGYKERRNDNEVMKAYDFLKNNNEELRCSELSVNMIHRHLHSLLWRNDRMGMMHSIESRFPFLDEEVMKFSLNLPSKFKIGKTSSFYNWKHPFMMDKAVVRNFGDQLLPKELVKKKKFGFGVQGHANAELKVDLDFFKNGFWQKACGMNQESLKQMYTECDPKLLAKLSSVEVWGSLFILKQTKEEVNQRVQSNFRMKI
jgi:asparagine synthase (glutamine-hydrolysing)